jgi:hypothetical protein
VSDRPDFTESAVVVPAGSTQLEAGTTVVRAGEAWETSAGEVLVRASLHERAELRLGATYEGVSGPERRGGFADPSVGAKLALRDGGDAGISVAAIVATTLPMGTGPGHAARAQPELKLGVARPFGERVGIASNLNYAWEDAGHARLHAFGASVSVGVGLTETVGSYVEAYMLDARGDGARAASYVNAGMTRAIGGALQLDARVGANTAAMREDYFVGLGVVRRW